MKKITNIVPLLMVLLAIHHTICAQLLPNYANSWLGNTFGTPANHIPHSIDNLYVTPSGKVATITGWEEGGHNVAVFDGLGNQIGIPQQSGTGSWGRFSGNAVFMDDQYVYQIMKQKGCDGNNGNLNHFPVCGTQWFCVRRFFLNGNGAPFSGGKGYDGSFLIVNTDATDLSGTPLNGVVVLNNELYVSDKLTNSIKVYNAATMSATVVRTLSVGYSGLLDYDSQGNIWLLDTIQQKIVCFSPTGVLQTPQITLPVAKKATAFCIDKVNNKVLVANNGIDQNILIYTSIFSNPAQTSTMGLTGGINAGLMGEVAPLKFSEPKGVGIDNLGNVYVGNNGVWQGGARLEKYNAANTMLWRLNGLMFTDNGTVDPTSETDFYTKEFHLTLNLNNTLPGTEWQLKGMTINRFAFPEDDRITDSNGFFWTSAYVRNVAGKRLLFVSDMYGKRLAIYKFNPSIYAETAIPSAFVGHNSTANTEFIWTDNNNDQLHQTNEYDNRPTNNFYLTHIVPDQQGNIWKTNREAGIRYFPMQGFNANGNPNYSYATSTLFPNVSGIYDIKRIEYDNATGALYVTGRSASSVSDNWGCAGDVLARYNNYLTNPTALPAWSVAIPFFAEGTPAADNNIKAFCLAGDYIFTILTKNGKIVVREKATGNVVGDILPTSATNFVSGWSDINGAIQAHKRVNGEYMIFAEENSNGKIMMYRWCPTGNCAPIVVVPPIVVPPVVVPPVVIPPVVVSPVTGIATEEKIIVYPNPTNDYVLIDIKGIETLQLFNSFGHLLSTKVNVSGLQKIELQHLPNGLYLIKTKTLLYKIVKK